MFIPALCLGVQYEPRKVEVISSFTRKKPWILREYEKCGWDVYVTGGLAHISKKAQIIVEVEVSEDRTYIDVAPFFRECWKRLTKKRSKAILASFKPGEALVQKNGGKYAFETNYLEDWRLRCSI